MKRLSILLTALLFAAAAGAYEVPKWRVVTDTANVRKTYQDGYIFQGRHYVGMNGYLKELAQGAGSAFVQDTVYTDVIFPSKTGTIYIRHATVDTIIIQRIIHQQEVAQFDSVAEWVGDGDTLRIDASINGNILEYEDENVVVAALDSAGNWSAQNLVAKKKLTVADSARNEGPLRQKGTATFGATATPATIGVDGSISGQSLTGTETLGAELITNFAGWTPTTNWTYADSKWSHATGNATALVSDWSPTVGVNYKVVYTIAQSVAGTGVVLAVGGVSFPTSSAAGTYTYYIIAPATTALRFTPESGGTWVGDITAVSVKAVTNGNASFINGSVLGQLIYRVGSSAYPSLACSDGLSGIFSTVGQLGLKANGSTNIYVTAGGIYFVGLGSYISFRNLGTYIYSGADNQIDFRNSTNPNILNFYNTYTSATNYKRGFARATATAIEFGAETGSAGGTALPVNFYTKGTIAATIDTSQNIGIGTQTPFFDLSIVNSNPATNNGVHVVDSNVNKNRTTYAQATDSASAVLSTIGGNGWLRLRGAKGGNDSLAIYTSNGNTFLSSNGGTYVQSAGGSIAYFSPSISSIYTDFNPITTDSYSLGSVLKRYKGIYVSDNGQIGGKGQTANLTVSRENVIAGSDSSAQVKVVDGIGGVFKSANSAGDSLRWVGVQGPTYVAARGDIWLSRNGGTTPRDTLWAKVHADSSAYVVFTARAKAH